MLIYVFKKLHLYKWQYIYAFMIKKTHNKYFFCPIRMAFSKNTLLLPFILTFEFYYRD